MAAVLTVLILLVVGALGSSVVLSLLAKQQKDVLLPISPQAAAEVVSNTFRGMWWREVRGRGDLNYECKGMGMSSMSITTKPVISVSIEPTAQGTQVSVWMSEYGSAWGQIGCPDRVVLKRSKLLRELRSAVAAGGPHSINHPPAGATMPPVPGAGPNPANSSPASTNPASTNPASTRAPWAHNPNNHAAGYPGTQPGGPPVQQPPSAPTPTFGPGSGTPGRG